MTEETEQDSVEDQIEALVSAELNPEIKADEENKEEADETPDANETDEAGDEEEQGEVAQIDYDQQIPMPDGRDTMTLSALKDRVIQLERTEESIISRENAIMTQQDELSDALAQAGGEIPPALKQQMAQKQKAYLQSQHEAMLAAIPEWKDPAAFKQAREGIMEVGKQYGLSEEEIGGISDHRVIKFMHDYSRLIAEKKNGRDSIEKLKANRINGKKKQLSSKSARLNKQVSEAASGRDRDAKLAAMDALLLAG